MQHSQHVLYLLQHILAKCNSVAMVSETVAMLHKRQLQSAITQNRLLYCIAKLVNYVVTIVYCATDSGDVK